MSRELEDRIAEAAVELHYVLDDDLPDAMDAAVMELCDDFPSYDPDWIAKKIEEKYWQSQITWYNTIMETTIIQDVQKLINKGWEESEAIRATAHKHDIPDYELALFFLELYSKELV